MTAANNAVRWFRRRPFPALASSRAATSAPMSRSQRDPWAVTATNRATMPAPEPRPLRRRTPPASGPAPSGALRGWRARSSIICRRRARLTASTSAAPRSLIAIVTSRRLSGDRWRSTIFLPTNRSQRRVTDEGATSSSSASAPVPCGPRLARTTSTRYCARVTSAGAAAKDRTATATSTREANNTASVTSSTLSRTAQELHRATNAGNNSGCCLADQDLLGHVVGRRGCA